VLKSEQKGHVDLYACPFDDEARTAWSGGLSEKQTDSQVVKEFPALYGTRRFITALTTAPHKIIPRFL
jgi:hypothetical protein